MVILSLSALLFAVAVHAAPTPANDPAVAPITDASETSDAPVAPTGGFWYFVPDQLAGPPGYHQGPPVYKREAAPEALYKWWPGEPMYKRDAEANPLAKREAEPEAEANPEALYKWWPGEPMYKREAAPLYKWWPGEPMYKREAEANPLAKREAAPEAEANPEALYKWWPGEPMYKREAAPLYKWWPGEPMYKREAEDQS